MAVVVVVAVTVAVVVAVTVAVVLAVVRTHTIRMAVGRGTTVKSLSHFSVHWFSLVKVVGRSRERGLDVLTGHGVIQRCLGDEKG